MSNNQTLNKFQAIKKSLFLNIKIDFNIYDDSLLKTTKDASDTGRKKDTKVEEFSLYGDEDDVNSSSTNANVP